MTYIVDVIGNPSSGANQLLICHLMDNTFFQSQGSSLLCGVCAINNSVGKEIVTVNDLDIVADKLFIKSIHEGEIDLTGPVVPTRSPLGDYFVEVLEVAAQQKDVEMIRIRDEFYHMKDRYFLSNLLEQSLHKEPGQQFTKLLIVKLHHYYMAMHIHKDYALLFDSLKAVPVKLTFGKASKYILDKTAAVFIVFHKGESSEVEDVSTKVIAVEKSSCAPIKFWKLHSEELQMVWIFFGVTII